MARTFFFLLALLLGASSAVALTHTSDMSSAALLSDTKLVLIGVAVKQNSQVPVSQATVILVDMSNGNSRQFTTSVDGQFYFKLESDRSYSLTLLNAEGVKEDVRIISTANKLNPEVLHTVLQSADDTKSNGTPRDQNFAVPKQNNYAKQVR